MTAENSPAFVGHELRTLFALILANIDILEMEKGSSEWIDDIREECKRSTHLINMLMEGPEQNPSVKPPFNVANQIDRMTYFFRPLAREKHLSLKQDLDQSVTSRIDRSEVVQVFSALVGNAVKYCDPNGEIAVSLTREGERFRFIITNTYAAASEDEARRFFESHYRGHHGEEEIRGYGIGLAIAREIIAHHSGSLDVSADERAGTVTFTMVM